MSILTLKPSWHLAVPYTFTPQLVHYFVESEYATDVFIIDETGLVAFRAGQPFGRFRESTGLTIHNGDIQVVGPARWYLLIVNTGLLPAATYYHVWTG